MKRSGFKKKVYERKEAPKLQPIELPGNVKEFDGEGAGQVRNKPTVVKSDKLRRSAKGEACTMQIVGVCNHNPETTVLAHLPLGGELAGYKVTDISSAFVCSICHDAVDSRVVIEHYEEHADFYCRRAMVRTWTRWIELGLIDIK